MRIIARLSGLFKGESSLTRDSFNLFLSDSVIMVLGVISSILLARLFGPQGKGIITMVSLVPLTVYYVGSLGLIETSTFFISRYRGKERENFFTIHLLSWIFGIAAVAVAYITFGYWYPLYGSYPRELFIIILPSALFLILIATSRYGLLGFRDIFHFNALNIGQGIMILLIVVIAGLFMERSLKAYCYLSVILPALLAVYGASAVLRRPGMRSLPSRLNIGPVMSYAVRNYPSSLIIILQTRLDHFLIGYFLDPAQLGIYSIAILLSENLLRITAAFQLSLFQRVSADRSEQHFALAARVLRVTNLLNIILSVSIIVIGYPLIKLLFGAAFLPAYLPLAILLVARVPEGLYKIISSSVAGIGRPGLLSALATMGIIVNGVLGWVLIPRMGLVGASIAKTISLVVQLAPVFIFFTWKSKLSFAQCLIVNRDDYDLVKTKITNWLGTNK